MSARRESSQRRARPRNDAGGRGQGPGTVGRTRAVRGGAGRQAQSRGSGRAPRQLGPVITHPERRERKPAERAGAGGGGGQAGRPSLTSRADKGLGGSRAPRRRRRPGFPARLAGPPPARGSQWGPRSSAPRGTPLSPVPPARRGQRRRSPLGPPALFLPACPGGWGVGEREGAPTPSRPRGRRSQLLFVPLLWAKRGLSPGEGPHSSGPKVPPSQNTPPLCPRGTWGHPTCAQAAGPDCAQPGWARGAGQRPCSR